MTTAWLIECGLVGSNTDSYYCGEGDWCSNPNHAHKFATEAEAATKASTMTAADPSVRFTAREHGWDA
jgi:hypothetical protein